MAKGSVQQQYALVNYSCLPVQVKPENAQDFEEVWKNRDSKLLETPGFIRFALLRGDEEGESA